MKREEQIESYIALMKDYNQKVNLYSEGAYHRLDFHIQDSCRLASLVGDVSCTVVDLGSGSGLPSVILAIQNPNNRIIAVESKRKKTVFLELVKQELRIKNYEVVTEDVNKWFCESRVRPDVITAKAFAPIHTILKICKSLSRSRLIVPISLHQKNALAELGFLFNSQFEADGFYYLEKML